MTRDVLGRRRGTARAALDPREPWELEVDEPTARAHASTGLRGFPYRPRRLEDVPEGAQAALCDAVGAEGLGDLIVVPGQSRPTASARGRRHVLTPQSVLGLGPGGMALWVGAPARPGVRAVVAAPEVAAIEAMHILLYARLTVLARDVRLSVRYNAVAEHDVHPLVLALRRRASIPVPGLPSGRVPDAGLAYKWRRLLVTDAVRLDGGESAAVVAGPLPVPRRAEPAYATAVLTARELVILADPLHADSTGGRYGVDVHHIPRAGIEHIRAGGPVLRVRARGADLVLPLGEELSGRVAEVFGPHLPMDRAPDDGAR